MRRRTDWDKATASAKVRDRIMIAVNSHGYPDETCRLYLAELLRSSDITVGMIVDHGGDRFAASVVQAAALMS